MDYTREQMIQAFLNGAFAAYKSPNQTVSELQKSAETFVDCLFAQSYVARTTSPRDSGCQDPTGCGPGWPADH